MTLLQDSQGVADLCARLSEAPFVTVDTEFIREKTYWPQLCLVQLASTEEAAAIDPLAEGIDLAPLHDLLRDDSVLKVFHAARQDVEIFHHQMGQVPAPIFDTQIAAMVCGFGDSVAYDVLVARLTRQKVDKASRFTDWARRPLTEAQLTYALSDVTHLRDVYRILSERMATTDRAEWIAEEMALLCAAGTYVTDPEEAWQRLKIRTRNAKVLGVSKAVAAWRERQAQGRDVPRNRILRDESIIEIANHAPTSLDSLARVRGVGDGMARGKFGQEILDAVGEGMANPVAPPPRADNGPRRQINPGPITDLLRVLLKMKSEQYEVAQKLIANANDLELIALDDDAAIPALSGWRYDVFGSDALALKRGEIGLAVRGGRVEIFKT